MLKNLIALIRRGMGTTQISTTLNVTNELLSTQIEQIQTCLEVISYAQKAENTQKAESYTYLSRYPNERLRVVFFFQVSSLWNNWQTLWEACQNDANIDAKVILTERSYVDSKLRILNEAKQFLINNNIPFIYSNAFSIEDYQPHVTFVQTPYYDTLPQKYSLEVLRRIGTRIAYIPYGLEIGGGAANIRYQFNMLVQQQAWRIFARSKRHSKMYAKYCSSGNDHVVVTGHPRMDLQSKQKNIKKESLNEKIKDRKCILWCPHFSLKPDQWSTFIEYYDFILEYFKKHPELFLIVRPHPFLLINLRDQFGWSREKIKSFKDTIENMTNACLDEHSDYLKSFHISDALLADAGSFLLEYFATGKPIAYLHKNNGPGLNDDGDIIQYFYVIHSTEDLAGFFKIITEDEDSKRDVRLMAFPEYLHNEENIGTTIKDYLLTHIDQYDKNVLKVNGVVPKHESAQAYWQKATNTYLASPEYYDFQEIKLKELLQTINKIDSALDIGCGDGRFTRLISKHSKYIKAIDVSPDLINQARSQCLEESIDFAIESIAESSSCHRYDLVACMGVTSSFMDDEVFLRTIDTLIASCKPGGYVLMKESLSLACQHESLPNEENYIAIYRNIEDYIQCFVSRGLQLIQQIELFIDVSRNLINCLFLFKIPLPIMTDRGVYENE